AAQLLAGRAPQVDRPARSSGGQGLAVGRIGQRGDLAGRAEEVALLPGGRVPQAHRPVLAPRGQGLAVGREREGAARPRVTAELAQFLAVFPEADVAVLARQVAGRGRERLAVGSEGDAEGPGGRSREAGRELDRRQTEVAYLFPRTRLPHADSPMPTPAGQP